jgi:Sulfotransferase family
MPRPAPGGAGPQPSEFARWLAREKRFWRRAVRHPRLIESRARRTASTKVAFVELNHDAANTLLLVGSGRSGTTWMAEVLTEALQCRLVYEPLRAKSVPWAWPVRPGHYAGADDEVDPAVAGVIDRILRGKIRNQFTDKYNTVRFPRRRLVKEVRATNLLPWLVRRYTGTPVVYLLRHPVPTAWSVTALGWPGKLEEFLAQAPLMEGPLGPFHEVIEEAARSSDRFHRVVLQWCLENYVPTRFLRPDQAHVVFYEHMVEDPWGELERLRTYLQRFGPGRWDLQMTAVTNVARPSHSHNRGSSGSGRIDRWVQEVPEDQAQKALALVRAFGLDRLYGEGTRPLLAADQVLLGGGPVRA